MKPKLKVNFIYNLISQLLILLVPLITTPYLSRILHEEGNGQYSYAFSIITYFVLFANLGFSVYGQREIAKVGDNKEKRSKIFWEIFLLRMVFALISFAALVLFAVYVGFGDKYNNLILILSLLVVGVIFDINFLFQGLENFKLIATRNIILKVITLIGVFLLVKEENQNWVYALIIATSTVFSYLIMWPSIIKNIQFVKWKNLSFRNHLKPAFLIFLPTLSATIYTVFDKTMIGLLAQNPDYANGCYEQAYKINNVALTLVCIISPIIIPRNANDYANGNIEGLKKHLNFACNYVLILSIPIIMGFLVLSENLSFWFLGEGYQDVPTLLRIMSIRLLVGGLTVVFGEQLFIAIGKEKYHSIATCVAAIGNVIINLILIPPLGAIGAAIATAISEILVMSVLCFFVVKTKFISLKHVLYMSYKYVIAAIVMGAAIYVLQTYMNYSILSFSIIVLVGLFTYAVVLLLLKDKFLYSFIHSFVDFIKKKRKKQISSEENDQ